jgi:hypothetical protein
LTISHNYNEELKDMFEDTKIIFFDYSDDDYHYIVSKFNQPINNLPENLTHLELIGIFTNDVIIPKNIDKLILSCNNCILQKLPEYIEKIYIEFDDFYPAKIVDNLSLSLKEIFIKNEYLKKNIKIPFGTIINISYWQSNHGCLKIIESENSFSDSIYKYLEYF